MHGHDLSHPARWPPYPSGGLLPDVRSKHPPQDMTKCVNVQDMGVASATQPCRQQAAATKGGGEAAYSQG